MSKKNIYEHLFLVVSCAIIIFIPFIVFQGYFFPFITGKNFLFRILVEVSGVLAICGVLEGGIQKKIYRNPLCIALSFFTLSAIVSTIFSVDPFRSFWSNFERMEGLVTYLHFFVYVAGLFVVLKEKMWDWIWNASLAGSIGMCFFSLYQILGFAIIDQGGGRVDGTLGNAIYLALYLLINIFITLFVFRKGLFKKGEYAYLLPSAALPISLLMFVYSVVNTYKVGGVALGFIIAALSSVCAALVCAVVQYFVYNKKYTTYYTTLFSALLVFQGIMLFYTGTRGSILGLAVGGFVMAIVGMFSKHITAIEKKFSIAIIACGIFSVFVFLGIRNIPAVKTHPVFGRIATVSFSDNTAQARFIIWGMALQGVKEHPVLGWGLEGFRNVFDKYYDPRMYAQEQWFDRTHNLYLDWAISGGFFGIASYLSLFGVLFWILYKKQRELQGEGILLFGLIVAYMVHNLFVFDNITSLILFGLILAYIGQKYVNDREGYTTPSLSLRVYGTIGVVCISIVCVGVNFYQMYANTLLIQTLRVAQSNPALATELFRNTIRANSYGNIEAREQLVQFVISAVAANIPTETKKQLAEFAIAEERESIQAQPNDARTWLFAGLLWRQLGNRDEAVTFLKKALTLSPQKQTLRLELINTYLLSKKYSEAYTLASETFNLDKRYDEARVLFAVSAIYAGKKTEAETVIAERFGTTTPFFDARILRAYIDTKNGNAALKPLLDLKQGGKITREQLVLLASVYLDLGRRAESIATLREIAVKLPETKVQIDGAIGEINAGRDPFH